jgi:ABC-2 type transport system permease protein
MAMGWNAVALNVLPVFNPTMGYVNYVVPAVFVLILHQVLLMGTGILGATQNQRSRRGESGYWQHAPVPALLLARTLVVGALFVLPVTYFFGFCFDHYGIARTAVPGELWLFTLPFLLATTWLGIVLGALFTRRDLPTQVVLVSSLPLVFLAGFIWPLELIPAPLNWLAQWAPSTPAIEGFLRLNQMGADFAQVSRYWWQLWGLALLYGALACWLLRWRQPCPATRPDDGATASSTD